VATTDDDVFGGGAKASSGAFVQGYEHDGFVTGSPLGRFPANFIHDGSEEVVQMFPHSKSGARKPEYNIKGLATGEQREVFGKDAPSGKYNVQPFTEAAAEEGSAARFFYVAKVSKSERNIGCEDIKPEFKESANFRPNHMEKALNGEDGNPFGRYQPINNNHPTVKPVALMKYLIKLVTPPGGKVLDPFNGSGSTGMAAVELGYDYTGIELDSKYVAIATKRIEAWWEKTHPQAFANPLFTEETK